jgi:hypothetical protein
VTGIIKNGRKYAWDMGETPSPAALLHQYIEPLGQNIQSLTNVVQSLQMGGIKIGSFATKALVPTTLSAPNWHKTPSVNDFFSVQADEDNGGAWTQYWVDSIDEANDSLTYQLDGTFESGGSDPIFISSWAASVAGQAIPRDGKPYMVYWAANTVDAPGPSAGAAIASWVTGTGGSWYRMLSWGSDLCRGFMMDGEETEWITYWSEAQIEREISTAVADITPSTLKLPGVWELAPPALAAYQAVSAGAVSNIPLSQFYIPGTTITAGVADIKIGDLVFGLRAIASPAALQSLYVGRVLAVMAVTLDVRCVSLTAPLLQPDWTSVDAASPAFIKNKPPILMPQAANNTTLTVYVNYDTGDDNNPGTETAPFKTLFVLSKLPVLFNYILGVTDLTVFVQGTELPAQAIPINMPSSITLGFRHITLRGATPIRGTLRFQSGRYRIYFTGEVPGIYSDGAIVEVSGPVLTGGLFAAYKGSIYCSPISFKGTMSSLCMASLQGSIHCNSTITLTGTVAVSGAALVASDPGSAIYIALPYTGSLTGTRYTISNGGCIAGLSLAQLNALPGSGGTYSAGSFGFGGARIFG